VVVREGLARGSRVRGRLPGSGQVAELSARLGSLILGGLRDGTCCEPRLASSLPCTDGIVQVVADISGDAQRTICDRVIGGRGI
jgi:hypothetical protein